MLRRWIGAAERRSGSGSGGRDEILEGRGGAEAASEAGGRIGAAAVEAGKNRKSKIVRSQLAASNRYSPSGVPEREAT